MLACKQLQCSFCFFPSFYLAVLCEILNVPSVISHSDVHSNPCKLFWAPSSVLCARICLLEVSCAVLFVVLQVMRENAAQGFNLCCTLIPNHC